MKTNSVKTVKLPLFDGLEVKSATFRNRQFPLHFHQNWSLAFIENGCENIAFNSTTFLLNKNALILIPPYSLHKNWGNKNNAWTYKAIYLNADVIKNTTKKLGLDYLQLSGKPYFITYTEQGIEVLEEHIYQILERLFKDVNEDEKATNATRENFTELLIHLDRNHKSIITLDSLEKRFKINKFKLLKTFKKQIGMSPLEYQMSLRIENSKQLFYEGISLAEIALEAGFYDQSHFTHCFKKYVGVTPGLYKQNSNILQDY